MPSVLKNVLVFTNLQVGVPAVQAHRLAYNGSARAPHNVWANAAGFVITADAANVSVTRNPTGPSSVTISVELWHSYEDAQPLPGGITAPLPFVMQGGGSVQAGDPTTLNAVNGSGSTLMVGTPVILSDGLFLLADASSISTSNVVGLIAVAATPDAIGVARLMGALTLTTAEWDAITDDGVGGLVTDEIYYLSTTTGRLTTTPSDVVSNCITKIGRAISPTIMLIDTEPPILL